jgi:ribosomal protein S18 acetylase RimI-like enzyme
MQALRDVDSGVEFIVRPAVPEDSEAIAVVHVAAWRETYAGIMSAERLAELSVERRTRRWYRMLTESPKAVDVIVAAREGQIVGFVACGNARDASLPHSGEIQAINVLRSSQGMGIGKALMRAAAGSLATSGHASAYLWVLEANRPARLFYERLGGVPVGERIEEIGGGPHPEIAYGWADIRQLTS